MAGHWQSRSAVRSRVQTHVKLGRLADRLRNQLPELFQGTQGHLKYLTILLALSPLCRAIVPRPFIFHVP